ncbi:hypothetical protein [Vibrio sp. THAF190c]|uniref:hypothetical protein n=1 Tax=Vibrio sp. THAF190c TaxID=2587865 RepID=UPI001267BDC0|nr:hypothetical protein [Vibrio sp. THAF190c]QFT13390.1 hypothetical protein FIV04_25905 [Vibrio sp. THAF190c]
MLLKIKSEFFNPFVSDSLKIISYGYLIEEMIKSGIKSGIEYQQVRHRTNANEFDLSCYYWDNIGLHTYDALSYVTSLEKDRLTFMESPPMPPKLGMKLVGLKFDSDSNIELRVNELVSSVSTEFLDIIIRLELKPDLDYGSFSKLSVSPLNLDDVFEVVLELNLYDSNRDLLIEQYETLLEYAFHNGFRTPKTIRQPSRMIKLLGRVKGMFLQNSKKPDIQQISCKSDFSTLASNWFVA